MPSSVEAYHRVKILSRNHPPMLQLSDFLTFRLSRDCTSLSRAAAAIPSLQLRQARCHDDEICIAMLLGLASGRGAEEDELLIPILLPNLQSFSLAR